MCRARTSFLALIVLVLGSLALAMAPVAAVQDNAKPHVLRVDWGDFPETLDPQKSDGGQWSVSGGIDYEGLTRIDEELQIVPGAAESWEFSLDGTAITFHLRGGLLYSDGIPVKAADFVYAAERICSPEVSSLSVDLLADVIGCLDLNASGGDATAAATAKAAFGVHALDNRTIEYRFTRPAPYFPASAALWATIPLRKDLVEQGGPDWWTNPATRIGNGPFKLVEYDAEGPDARLIYARNDRYWGGRTKLDEVEFVFLDYGDPATMEAYRQGDIDVTWPNEETLPALEADPVLSRELVWMPDAGTSYLQFNLNKPPFQDLKVREAFAYAFDREDYCRLLSYGNCATTLSMIPPGMPGSIETDASAFDPEKARQALAESSYGGPENLPEITWYGYKDSPGGDTEARWLYEQYRQVLGIEMKMVYLSDEEHDALYDTPETVPQFHWSIWFAQPDPRGWLTIWRCNSPFSNGEGYCNPALDALLDRADAELDPQKRIAMYQEANRMLVADAPAIFVSTAGSTILIKPYVTGYSRGVAINGNWPGWMSLMTVDVARPG
jgi:oligopeptide transport system substrate-binding protein